MLSIIGYIKIDPADKARLKYLVASVKSFEFLKGQCRFALSIETDNQQALHRSKAFAQVVKMIVDIDKAGMIYTNFWNPGYSYGQVYYSMMTYLKPDDNDYILHFHEDHFCTLDDASKMQELLQMMEETRTNICRASFWEIETKCMEKLYGFHVEEGCGYSVWRNTKDDFEQFQSAYPGGRFYIGTNNIMERDFAKKFWDRPIVSKRPHEYEIQHFTPEFIHNVMVPPYEITAAIDDDHGENNSCLLKRKEQKFWDIYNAVEL